MYMCTRTFSGVDCLLFYTRPITFVFVWNTLLAMRGDISRPSGNFAFQLITTRGLGATDRRDENLESSRMLGFTTIIYLFAVG